MSQPPDQPKRRRPRFQFSLLALMVMMFALGAAAAPGYYLMRGSHELPQTRLVGMLMVLAGPLLVMTLLSILVTLLGRGDQE